MRRTYRILVVDDDYGAFERVPLAPGPRGVYEIARATTGAAAISSYLRSPFDLVVAELRLADMSGLELVRRILEVDPTAGIVIFAGEASVPMAVESIKAGASDFASKSAGTAKLRMLIDRALANRSAALDATGPPVSSPDQCAPDTLSVMSEAMRDVFTLVRSVASSDANILIVGETGTGKELVAREIHARSLRSARPLVTVNCAAIPRELFENELFGHERGAFTGADRAKLGLIGTANGGSLLLDEIGAMPLELQPKLLRVLQDRSYHRVGGVRPCASNFRLISSTNRTPRDLMSDGLFRDDLYYRISTVTIALPPLRERPEDLAPLAHAFLRRFAAKYQKPTTSFTAAAYRELAAYAWPGNVRELRNVVEHSVLLAGGPRVSVVGVPPAPGGRARATGLDFGTAAGLPSSSPDVPANAQVFGPPTSAAETLADAEKELLLNTLRRVKGSKSAAARLLGIYRTALDGKIKKHRLAEFMPRARSTAAPRAPQDPGRKSRTRPAAPHPERERPPAVRR